MIRSKQGTHRWLACIGLLLVLGLSGAEARAQFDSGSDGSDGVFELLVAGTYDFFDPNLFSFDPDGDGVYHFTTVTIGSGVNLTMRSYTKGPIIWLATGDVEIDGSIRIDGEGGHHGNSNDRTRTKPGAGGFPGGAGFRPEMPAESGGGPGGGQIGTEPQSAGGGAGHASAGNDGASPPAGVPGVPGVGGMSYGNRHLLPLIGGSGGAGSHEIDPDDGCGGGAGGGALLIASSGTIMVEGTIDADGGRPGFSGCLYYGGSGSGGAIRLMATAVTGNGDLYARGETFGTGGAAADGRIRIEAFSPSFLGTSEPAFEPPSPPGPLFLPVSATPIRVATVNGVSVPENPRAQFNPADVVIDASAPVTLEIEGRDVPVGTTVTVFMLTDYGEVVMVESTPLSGTFGSSTATAELAIPSGLSTFYLEANVNP